MQPGDAVGKKEERGRVEKDGGSLQRCLRAKQRKLNSMMQGRLLCVLRLQGSWQAPVQFGGL